MMMMMIMLRMTMRMRLVKVTQGLRLTLLEPREEDAVELEALGLVHRHQGHRRRLPRPPLAKPPKGLSPMQQS
jgi:hypothetical protein